MALFEERFEAWTGADFDAYAEPKWKSNRFSLERTRVKTRVVSLVEQALVRSGVPAVGVELWTSRHDPALVNAHSVSRQLVLLTRPVAAREAIEARDPGLSASEPDRFHAWLGVEVDRNGVAFRLCLPEGARMDRTRWPAHLAAWQALTLDHAVRIAGQVVPPESLTSLESQPVDVRLEQTFERQAALEGAAGIDDLALWLTRTLPILQALFQVEGELHETPPVPLPAEVPAEPQTEPHEASIASEVPVHVQVSPAQVPEVPPRRTGTYRPAGAPSRRAPLPVQERAPLDRIVPPTWKPEETVVGRQIHEGKTQVEKRPMPRPHADFRPQGGRDTAPRQQGQHPAAQRGPRPYEVASAQPLGEAKKAAPVQTILGPGARVKLTTGLFAGKFGTVTEIRGDDVQVMLGLMAVKVGKADVQLA